MTRFDAGSSTAVPAFFSSTTVRGLVALHPGTFVLSILLASLMIAVASGLLLVGQGARYQLGRTTDALQLSVFLQPQATRADAEALRTRIEAVPAVVGARLRTREDAMIALVSGGLPALSTKANPLPDVWIVSLGHATGSDGDLSFAARVARTRVALEALPNVESVRVDARWVDLLDRSSRWLDRGMSLAVWTIAASLLAALLGIALLTGRALKSQGQDIGDGVQALATVGMVSGLASLILAGGIAALVTMFVPQLNDFGKPVLDSIGRNGHIFVVTMGLAIIGVCALGHALGGSRR